jgi:hypothetical protein
MNDLAIVTGFWLVLVAWLLLLQRAEAKKPAHRANGEQATRINPTQR